MPTPEKGGAVVAQRGMSGSKPGEEDAHVNLGGGDRRSSTLKKTDHITKYIKDNGRWVYH